MFLLNFYSQTIPSTGADVQANSASHEAAITGPLPVPCSGSGAPFCGIELESSTECYAVFLENNVNTSSVPVGCSSLTLVAKKNGIQFGSPKSLTLNGVTDFASFSSFGASKFNVGDEMTLWISSSGSSSCAGSQITFGQYKSRFNYGFLFTVDQVTTC